MTILAKDIPIKKSFVYGGYLILKKLNSKMEKKVSILELAETLASEKIDTYSDLFYSLMFLFICGLIVFQDPYVELIKNVY